MQPCCCALLRGSKASPLPPRSLPVRGLPSAWKLFLLHSSLPKVQVPSLFFCLCFFFFLLPTQVLWDCLAFWEVCGLLPAFSRCSVGFIPHVDVFLMYLWGGRWSPRLTPPTSWKSPPDYFNNRGAAICWMLMMYQVFCWAFSYIIFYLYNKTARLRFYFILFTIEKAEAQKGMWFPLSLSGIAEIWSHVHVIPKSILILLCNLVQSVYSFEYFFLGRRKWQNVFAISQFFKLLHDLKHLTLFFIVHKPFSQAGPNYLGLEIWVPFRKSGTPYLLTYLGFQVLYYYVFSTISSLNNLEWGDQSTLGGWTFLLSFQSCGISHQWFPPTIIGCSATKTALTLDLKHWKNWLAFWFTNHVLSWRIHYR